MDDPSKGEKGHEDRPKLDWTDIAAFMIAAFQIMVPAALVLMGVLILFYLILKIWAG